MKRITAILLVCMMLVGLVSCGPYSDEDANAILNEMLTKVSVLNQHIYGDAFKTKEDPGDDVNATFQKYYEVAEDSKYLTLTTLKAEVDSLFGPDAREDVYAFAFDGTNSEDSSTPPRFAENAETKNLEINVADKSDFQLRTVALLSSAKVKRSNATHIRAEITVYRTIGGVQREEQDIINLVQENGVWKFVETVFIGGVTEIPLV